MHKAILFHADLSLSDMAGLDLSGADLRGAKFEVADIKKADNLDGAWVDADTCWPKYFIQDYLKSKDGKKPKWKEAAEHWVRANDPDDLVRLLHTALVRPPARPPDRSRPTAAWPTGRPLGGRPGRTAGPQAASGLPPALWVDIGQGATRMPATVDLAAAAAGRA